MSYIGKNIKKIRTVKNLSQAAFAQLFNLARPSVGAYEEGRSEPKIDTLVQIAKHFGVSVDALLTKELTINELYKFDIFKQNYKKGDVLIKVAEAPTPTAPPDSIALVKATDAAKYAQQHSEQEYLDQLPLLHLAPAGNRTTRAFAVAAHDMAPTLPPASIAIAAALDLTELPALQQGQVYVLVTKQEVLLRRLLAVQDEKLLVKADQAGTAAYTLPFTQLSEVWEVQGVYSQLLSQPLPLEERLALLEETVQQLNLRVQQLEK
ncbi:helix-turn-helix domain-containing protein [Pontibacter akesuensis]|uniref:DNA-binding transcriptional regulator, XRE-family HTH domain n=1 Tax=Pontibacter akesuensis TaxID=388950 RepID=A0A1I7K6E0_9BACT|nr:helix-turn-helix transcriptional regulator [Pontibacter akesuensis]GHA74708.1 hypothetical protein GCM10007389_30600 [Pontibacter akesuensis]SFU93005.1 DNA-binding transcriptional regulator, XRE-family HTH domain [Pontibacter akesuensis]